MKVIYIIIVIINKKIKKGKNTGKEKKVKILEKRKKCKKY
jgi:hypothetical protein